MEPQTLSRRGDTLLLAILVVARLRIDTLAEAAVLPTRLNDVANHPFLGHILAADAARLLAQQQLIDPIGLLLVVGALACLIAYAIVTEFVRSDRVRYNVCLCLIWLIVILAVVAPGMKMMLLRQESGPASYSHDGGVIQTEATIDFFLTGRNPYVEDYLNTPMAEWGIDEFRSALYHYPYLPWTFVFSAPFKLASTALFGWFDQRMVYLLLFLITLAAAPRLAHGTGKKLGLVMAIGLNPIMGSDLIYGQNDSFVLAWLVISLWLWRRGYGSARERWWFYGSATAMGLGCASKPTAWFVVPCYLMLMAGGDPADLWRRPAAWLRRAFCFAWPLLVVACLLIGPYLLWDARAIYDDVWGWSSGTSASAYQIWGWGGSNLILALGWVKNRFEYWPFWIPELLVGLPLFVAWIRMQVRHNEPGQMMWGYGLWLAAFFFVSRFLNENYLGFIVACLALGALIAAPSDRAEVDPTGSLGKTLNGDAKSA